MAPHAEDPAIEAVTDTQSAMIPDPILHKNPTQLYKSPAYERLGVNDVLPFRTTCPPMSKSVAAFSSAEMFKSVQSKNRKLKAKDWSERFSVESKARKASSLKGAMKYFKEGVVSLCGGLPSADYFPFEELSVKVPRAAAAFSSIPEEEDLVTMSGGKYDVAEGKSEFDLSIALNYGQSMGPPQLMRFVTEHTEIIHDPSYSDWEICLTSGSTSALDIALRIFTERGHALLTEEYSFSSAIETALPLGIKPIGIKMDEHGMLDTDLDYVLSNWNEQERGAPKPFLVYTVPTGQNPTSSTQPIERRKAIYAVAEKHDLFILEDEPYYFLQMDTYASLKSQSTTSSDSGKAEPMSLNSFLQSLTPSYLSLDTTGRVLRMDSFSKIVAPGSRTGWVTGPPQVIERFIRHSEVSAQNPSGFAMMSLYKLLDEQWGHEGFLRWLMYLRNEYSRRRNVIVGACEEFLPAESGVCSWTPPKAGMFHWIKTDISKHPLWKAELKKNSGRISHQRKQELAAEIEEKVFLTAVKHKVLVARGSWFRAEKDNSSIIPAVNVTGANHQAYTNGHAEITNGHQTPIPEQNVIENDTPDLFFRMTFAAAAEDKMAEAVKRFGDALREEFELTQ